MTMNLPSRKTFLLLALLVCLNLFLASRAAADGVIHFIVGYVRDGNGNPIVGLDVRGDDYVGDTLESWPTDADGMYKIDAQTDGNYRVVPDCSELTARGFHCVPPVAVSVAVEMTYQDFVVEPATNASLEITNTFLPKGNVGMPYSALLAANGGRAPYLWQLTADSAPLPAGLALQPTGIITGTPRTNVFSNLKIQVRDADFNLTTKILPLAINPRPILSSPFWGTNFFSLRLTGASNQNYTLQVCTNLSSTNWTSLFVTNHPTTNAYLLVDPNTPTGERFYRVLIGP